MTTGEDTSEPTPPKRQRSARQVKAPANAAGGGTRTPRRGKGSGKGTASVTDPNGGESPADATSGIIAPAVQDISQTLAQAIEPAMQEYQREMASAMTQHIESVLPAVREILQHEAEVVVDEALGAMQADEPVPPDRSGSGQTQEEPEGLRRIERTSGNGMTEEQDGAGHGRPGTSSTNQSAGGNDMTTETGQSETTNDQQANQSQAAQPQANNQQSGNQQNQPAANQQGQQGNKSGGGQRPRTPARTQDSGTATYYYDPRAAAQAGLLELATVWKNAGGYYQSIYAYMEILTRYPQTGAAAAATEGLVDLARTFEQQGRFYAAMDIYHKLENML